VRIIHASVLAAAFVVLLSAAGCGSDNGDTPTTPTVPTVPSPLTSTWWGVLPVPGSVTRSFVAAKAGGVTVTITELSGSPQPMSLGIGIPQSGESGCILNQVVPAVSQTSPIFNINVDPGTFCLKLASTGTANGSVSFSVTLVHP